MTDQAPAEEPESSIEPMPDPSGPIGAPAEAGPAGETAPPAAPAPPGQDLRHQRGVNESDAEFMARTRGVVVQSESPTDIVPNQPNISMGQAVPVEGAEEELRYAKPPEGEGLPAGGESQEIADQAGHGGTEEEPYAGVTDQSGGTTTSDTMDEPGPAGQPSAADLIEQAKNAETAEELDAIEAQAHGRVTVEQAVAARRAELGA